MDSSRTFVREEATYSGFTAVALAVIVSGVGGSVFAERPVLPEFYLIVAVKR